MSKFTDMGAKPRGVGGFVFVVLKKFPERETKGVFVRKMAAGTENEWPGQARFVYSKLPNESGRIVEIRTIRFV